MDPERNKDLYVSYMNKPFEKIGNITIFNNESKRVPGFNKICMSVNTNSMNPSTKADFMAYLESLDKPTQLNYSIDNVIFSAHIEQVIFKIGTPYFRNDSIKVSINSLYHNTSNFESKISEIVFYLVVIP